MKEVGEIPEDFAPPVMTSSLKFDEATGCLSVLDQLQLPHNINFIAVASAHDAYDVIKKMQVRGAPLIAVVAALSLYAELERLRGKPASDIHQQFIVLKDKLLSSRPTAVNLANALSDIQKVFEEARSADDAITTAQKECLRLYHDEVEENRRLLWVGFTALTSLQPLKKLRLMTICNTGFLATVSYGTALVLHQAGKVEHVYCLETRPYNQGSRLTTFELHEYGVDFHLITDSMAAWAMKTKGVDAILVGADNVALNGDFANKIGTYALAVLARHHGIPFYACVPFTSVNAMKETGDDIVIEERPADELRNIAVAPSYSPVWNPAFDVTPKELVTGYITDRGYFEAHELRKGLNL